jgi:hypothetical protein
MHHIQRRLSPSIVVAIIALFVAVTGTATAATVIITSPDQLASNVVTGPKIANHAVTANKLAAGATPNVLSAKVDKAGQLIVGARAVSARRVAKGIYQVRFNRPVQNCSITGTARETLALVEIDRSPDPEVITVSTNFLAPDGATLFATSDNAFDLWGVC